MTYVGRSSPQKAEHLRALMGSDFPPTLPALRIVESPSNFNGSVVFGDFSSSLYEQLVPREFS